MNASILFIVSQNKASENPVYTALGPFEQNLKGSTVALEALVD